MFEGFYLHIIYIMLGSCATVCTVGTILYFIFGKKENDE